MEYTIKIWPQKTESKLKAMVDVTFGPMTVKGWKIFEGSNGLFVSDPSTKGNKTDENGKDIYYDNVRFIDPKEEEERFTPYQKELHAAILAEFATQSRSSSKTAGPKAQTEAGEVTKTAAKSKPKNSLW